MINIPSKFQPKINTTYPPHNFIEYERWLHRNFNECSTDREYLPIYWTGYYVNNNYGSDKQALSELQSYLNGLDNTKKYWTCIQYDDSILNDVSHLDLLQFNMSKNIGVPMPLIGQEQPYKFTGGKKWFANFIGSKTHPIRNHAEGLKNVDGYYISFVNHDIEHYCNLIYRSMFTLCFRGYGINSFRAMEAMQYGSIPVYISDEFIDPYGVDFNTFGIKIHERYADKIDYVLQNIPLSEIIHKQDAMQHYYNEYFTYHGNLKQIIKHLESEYNSRK